MASPQERFAHRLRTAMQEKYGPNARATQLSADTGLSVQTISTWLKAKVVPTPAYLARLAPAFNIPLAEWLAVAGHVAPAETTTGHYPEWGELLNAGLKDAGRTDEWLAGQMRLTAETLGKWLDGRSAPHSADVAIDIAHLLGGDAAAYVAAAGHPRTAALLRERTSALENHPVIQRIRTDKDLTPRQKDVLIEEALRRQHEEIQIFEQRVADAVRTRRQAGRGDQGAGDGRAATG